MSVLGLSAAFFSFVVPALSDRFGRRPVIVIFNLIGLLVPLAALHFHGSLFMLGTLIFFGWSASGTFPLFMGTVPSETIPARYVATSLGMVVGLGEILGGVGAPAIAGRAADHYGLQAPAHDHGGLRHRRHCARVVPARDGADSPAEARPRNTARLPSNRVIDGPKARTVPFENDFESAASSDARKHGVRFSRRGSRRDGRLSRTEFANQPALRCPGSGTQHRPLCPAYGVHP